MFARSLSDPVLPGHATLGPLSLPSAAGTPAADYRNGAGRRRPCDTYAGSVLAATEDREYHEKRWSVRGDELRWVFTVGSRTYRTMLSKTIRPQLGSSNSQNMTADRAMRPALRSLVVGRASAP